ncbi:Uu.00g110970.m01.CDS01 [Anthostomella pinea]|uniref:Uu.00g110970.m01.CDS01 n=1 Tax=Anthostomella pinea TaxID=933095 RepID=A0AAI8YGB0_9PEZI|nr:Uu.00g110970.m01.CDS01 [Anthostomella pinea]
MATATAFSSQHDDVLSSLRSLRAIDPMYAQLFKLGGEWQNRDSDAISVSTGVSVASSECSGGMDMPSIGTRDESVSTGTSNSSLDPERQQPSPTSCTIPSPMNKSAGASWVDLEVDDTMPSFERRHNSMVDTASPSHLLVRREDVNDLRSLSLNSKTGRPNLPDPFTAFCSTPPEFFNGITVPTPPTYEKRLAGPPDFPKRRSSLRHTYYPVPPQLNISPQRPYSPVATRPSIEAASPDSTPSQLPPRRKEHAATPEDEDEDKMSALSSEVVVGVGANAGRRRNSYLADIMNPEIASPHINPGIESWLESSLVTFTHGVQSGRDGLVSPPLPLPSHVLDTLQVMVSCFPETMLLCSSLSIETIRNRSKRLGHRAENLRPNSRGLSALEPDQPKQSKWNMKWMTSKQHCPPSPYPARPGSKSSNDYYHQEPLSAGATPFWLNRPDWVAIKNIFPSGTDYLCDALYAHLLAYNYITQLCPRSALINPMLSAPSTPGGGRRPVSHCSTEPNMYGLATTPRSSESDGTKIPRKAASLLGLQNNPGDPMPEPPSSAGNRMSTLRGKRSILAMGGLWRTDSRSSGGFGNGGGGRPMTSAGPQRPGTTDHGEHTLKEIRLGLAKCIARLVSTLRQAGTDGGGEMADKGGVKPEEDPLFMRSLCEIVRCCEER